MSVHKRIWRKGFRNPDKYGMFRTKDINLMTINEVYIGGIYGQPLHNGKIVKKSLNKLVTVLFCVLDC